MNQVNCAVTLAQPMSDVQQALSRITLAQNELSAAVGGIFQTLAPVLRCEPPMTENTTKAGFIVPVPSSSSPLVNDLNDRAEQIERETRYLQSLHGRITL